MANSDYYDLRKLRTLVDPTLRSLPNNPNTAYFNSPKFTPSVTELEKKAKQNKPKKKKTEQ